MNFKKLFIDHCKSNQLEINNNQVVIIDNINKFYQNNFKQNLFLSLFTKQENKRGFYLQGDVGVGKNYDFKFFL